VSRLEEVEKNTDMNRLGNLAGSIEEGRKGLMSHNIYSSIVDLTGLKRFTQTHVFAVWDFMSLLKSLQRDLTCVSVPWLPVGDAESRFLINEIVVGEESDVDRFGKRISHFELYLDGMREMGASTTQIDSLVSKLASGNDLCETLGSLEIDSRVRDFLAFTFDIALNAPTHVKAAVFTFGREDVIPDMFIRILDEIGSEFPGSIDTFRYYIERHIEVDGGHHKALAHRMVENLCGDDSGKWEEARTAAENSLEHRVALWDSVVDAINDKSAN
jgi:hypothetical protein